MKLRGCISLGNTKTVSKTLEDVISFEIVSMSSESFGSYDNVKTLYTSINESNRILTSDVISDHNGYVLDIYAHGKIDSAINLSTMIQIGEEEFYKYGKTVPYAKNTYLGDFHVGKFVFDGKTTVKPIYNFSGIKNGGWVEIKYLCDLSTLPTVATMDEYLSGEDNMILELSDKFEIKNIIFNDNVYELSTKIETTLSNDVIHTEYALFDTTNVVDDMKGLKKIYISDSIKEIAYTTNGGSDPDHTKNLKSIKLNKTIEKISKNGFRTAINLESLDMINSNLREVGYASFYQYPNGTKLSSLIFPMSLKIIDERAFGYNKKLRLVSIPYDFETIASNAFE
jgi:hypothetical protein